MSENRRISVIIKLEGSEAEFADSLQSVLHQNEVNMEVVVVGASEEFDCEQYLDTWCTGVDVIYIPADADVNKGIMLNAATDAASGEWIAYIVSGDIWEPEKTLRQIQRMEQEKARWSYCAAEVQGEDNICIPPAGWPEYKKKGFIFPDVLMNTSIAISTVVIEKKLWQKVGGFEESLPALQDYEFLLRVAQQENPVFLEETLVAMKPQSWDPETALITQCYCMAEFSEELSNLGLKKEKLQQVMKMAEDFKKVPVFCQYVDILKEDAEYRRFLEQYLEAQNPVRYIKKADATDVRGVHNCVGCGACQSVCPVNAIIMVESKEGFLYPQVDEQLCIRCGKCLLHCPTQQILNPMTNPQVCYAVQMDDNCRRESSSGGIFPAIGQEFLKQGGVVCGAVFRDDFSVCHIVSDRERDLSAMRSSKYLQSDTTGTYEKVREKLDEKIPVFFTGCACQIAGLKAYLRKEYDNLYTMDVVCHGVPSPKIWREYVCEHENKDGKLSEISFRKKDKMGWSTGVYMKHQNGKEYLAKGGDIFIVGFLNNWYLRESCYQCEFKGRKYSDLTVGDFWGIDRLSDAMEDGKGTSYLTINSTQGVNLFNLIKPKIKKIATFANKDAVKYNPSILQPTERTKIRDYFLKNNKQSSLSQRVVHFFDNLHFEIGLVLWWSPNYGNALTNYALYQILNKTHDVLAIDNMTLYPPERFGRFAKEHYRLSSEYYPYGQRKTLQEACGTLIVGSDQTWNYYFEQQFGCGKYYQLDFADDYTRKISYAASFGMEGAEAPEEYASDYQRFQAISVREEFGVDICKKKYGVDAQWVLDPVFLLEGNDYDVLAEKSAVREEEPFIMAYLLNPTPEKREACKQIQKALGGIKIINVSENSKELRDWYRHILEFDHVQGDIEVEDWVYYMKNCKYVITDSFHGTCFAVIFQKNFLTFVNRQPDRFSVFKKFTGTSERIKKPGQTIDYDEVMKQLDYITIHQQLQEERAKSLEWLERALKS